MSILVRLVLVACAIAAFVGAGMSAAVRRYREMEEIDDDEGFTAIAGMLLIAGSLCAALGAGLAAIAALLLPVASAAYALTAQRLGVFRIDVGVPQLRVHRKPEIHT